jgi:hypothetical protein
VLGGGVIVGGGVVLVGQAAPQPAPQLLTPTGACAPFWQVRGVPRQA